jgi:hypothetical protein
MQVAERTIDYRRKGHQPHIVDTWILGPAPTGRPGPQVPGSDGPPLRDRGAGPDLSAPERFPASSRRPGAPRGRATRFDIRVLRDPVAALLRAGPELAVRLPDHGAAGQRDEDRRAADARVPPPAAGGPRPRARSRRGGRLHRHVPARGRPRRPPRGRDLALSVADADPGPVPGLRPPGSLRLASARPARVPGLGEAAGPGGRRPRGPHLPQRAPADLQDLHQLLLRLPRLLAGPLERLRRGQPGDRGGPAARAGPPRSSRRPRRHRDRGGHRRDLLRAARGRCGGPRRPRGAPRGRSLRGPLPKGSSSSWTGATWRCSATR